MRLHTKAPARIDLAGGTLDLWPLYLLHPGAMTVNLAINRYAHCVVEPRRDRRIILENSDTGERDRFASITALTDALSSASSSATTKKKAPKLSLLAELVRYFAPEKGLTLTTWSEVPAGAGLGGSSTLGVAIAAALARWTGKRLTRRELVSLVRDIEVRVLKVPTGEQDHFPAAFGGASAIHLEPIHARRESLEVDTAALESHLLLVYTGAPRRSGINNWEVFKKHLDGGRRLRRNFDRLSAVASSMRDALIAGQWPEVAQLLGEEWRIRRTNFSRISTPGIEKLMQMARREGAQSGKVCGAGGGGCIVFSVPPKRKGRVAAALAGVGAQVLPFRVARRGVQVRRLR